MGNQESRLCAICGLNEAMTRDHVPPRSIFPRPRPELITVPACESCNHDASQLDEAFKIYLALQISAFEDSKAQVHFENVLRTWRKNERLQRELWSRAEPVEFVTPTGITFGTGARILWNSKAHDAVIERIVRGLYYHHFSEVLGKDAPVSPKWFRRLSSEMVQAFEGCRRNVIGDDAFIYLYGRADDDPKASIWLFEFFGGHWAGATTGALAQG